MAYCAKLLSNGNNFSREAVKITKKFAHGMSEHQWITRDACLRLVSLIARLCKRCYLQLATACLNYRHLICSLASMLFKTMDLMPFIRPANSSVMIPRPCTSLALVEDM